MGDLGRDCKDSLAGRGGVNPALRVLASTARMFHAFALADPPSRMRIRQPPPGRNAGRAAAAGFPGHPDTRKPDTGAKRARARRSTGAMRKRWVEQGEAGGWCVRARTLRLLAE